MGGREECVDVICIKNSKKKYNKNGAYTFKVLKFNAG